MMEELVKSLGYCCVKAFLDEWNHISAKKLASALGVDPRTVNRWRDKRLLHKLKKCSTHCPQHPRKQIEFQKTASGSFRFRVYDVY